MHFESLIRQLMWCNYGEVDRRNWNFASWKIYQWDIVGYPLTSLSLYDSTEAVYNLFKGSWMKGWHSQVSACGLRNLMNWTTTGTIINSKYLDFKSVNVSYHNLSHSFTVNVPQSQVESAQWLIHYCLYATESAGCTVSELDMVTHGMIWFIFSNFVLKLDFRSDKFGCVVRYSQTRPSLSLCWNAKSILWRLRARKTTSSKK